MNLVKIVFISSFLISNGNKVNFKYEHLRK
jgi:hypothetical protein